MNFKLEVIIMPVSDVDRAKKFYENLGWRLDADFAQGDFRVVQLTPPNSDASIIFCRGVTSAKTELSDNLVFAVDDVDVSRAGLIYVGVNWSEVLPFAVRPFI